MNTVQVVQASRKVRKERKIAAAKKSLLIERCACSYVISKTIIKKIFATVLMACLRLFLVITFEVSNRRV